MHTNVAQMYCSAPKWLRQGRGLPRGAGPQDAGEQSKLTATVSYKAHGNMLQGAEWRVLVRVAVGQSLMNSFAEQQGDITLVFGLRAYRALRRLDFDSRKQ
jgi:hypothetical protein